MITNAVGAHRVMAMDAAELEKREGADTSSRTTCTVARNVRELAIRATAVFLVSFGPAGLLSALVMCGLPVSRVPPWVFAIVTHCTSVCRCWSAFSSGRARCTRGRRHRPPRRRAQSRIAGATTASSAGPKSALQTTRRQSRLPSSAARPRLCSPDLASFILSLVALPCRCPSQNRLRD